MKEPVRAVAGGIAVGIANVIPGVSGGTMMAIMNIFNRTMEAISGITKKDNKNRLKDILFLGLVGVGAVIGVLVFSWLLELLFTYAPMPTVFWFVGLVALSVPVFMKNQMKGQPIHVVGLLAGVAVIVALTVLKLGFFPDGDNDVTNPLPAFDPLLCAMLFGAGAVGGFSMLLPGVSGSLMLMILGLYETIYFCYINNASELFKNLSFDTILKFVPAGFFAIGMLLGIVLSAKITAFALKKNARITLSFLLGLVATSAASVIALNYDVMLPASVIDIYPTAANPTMIYVFMIVGSVVAFAVGGALVWWLGNVTSED